MKSQLLIATLLGMATAPAAFGGGLRGEIQLDQAISPSGTTDSEDTDIAASGNNVYAAWTETAVSPSSTNEIYYCRSTDGGRSWSTAQLLSDSSSIDDASPSVAVDGNLVVVAWLHGDALLTQDVQGVISTDGGATFGSIKDLSGNLKNDFGDADDLTVRVDGTNIYLKFEDDNGNPGADEDVYVVVSNDSGVTFTNPIKVNDPHPGTADVDSPILRSVGSTVYLVWVDKRTGKDRVYFDRSVDGGHTWGTDLLLDRSGALADSDTPTMTADGTNVYVAWVDDRNDPGIADQVFFTSSSNSGVSFAADKKIGSASLGADADEPHISTEGGYVYLTWVDSRNGAYDVFFTSSSNGGSSFAGEFALDVDGGTVADKNTHIRSQGDSVFVSYQEETYTPLMDQVWLDYSPDHGAAGTFQRLRLSATLGTTNDADANYFAVTGGRDVVGIWVDDRAGNGKNDVYVNGQRFPNLTEVPNGKKTSFQLSDATPAEEGKLYLALISTTGTDSFLLPNGMNLCLTIDSFTLLLLQPWAIPLVSDTVAGGSASTVDLPLKVHGFCAGLVIDPLTLAVVATTDPVTFN